VLSLLIIYQFLEILVVVILYYLLLVDMVRIELTLTIMSGCHDIVSYYTSSLSLSIVGMLLVAV
jgi:hypothetical protein